MMMMVVVVVKVMVVKMSVVVDETYQDQGISIEDKQQ